ncbi:hypothetical protein M3J09_013173 [Ascochyta lentis]
MPRVWQIRILTYSGTPLVLINSTPLYLFLPQTSNAPTHLPIRQVVKRWVASARLFERSIRLYKRACRDQKQPNTIHPLSDARRCLEAFSANGSFA